MREIKKEKSGNNVIQPETPKIYTWLASAATSAIPIANNFLPKGHNPYVRIAGTFVLLLAGCFIFLPFYQLSKYGGFKKGKSYTQSRCVVNRGLYAITRHPQYLGYIYLACGFALLAQHWVICLLAVISTTCFYKQAVNEEIYCLARFGTAYEDYCQNVPRFNIVAGIFRVL